jgi:hypothetical protein
MNAQDPRDLAYELYNAQLSLKCAIITLHTLDAQKFASIINDLHHARYLINEAFKRASFLQDTKRVMRESRLKENT